jgi:hypothetical protein
VGITAVSLSGSPTIDVAVAGGWCTSSSCGSLFVQDGGFTASAKDQRRARIDRDRATLRLCSNLNQSKSINQSINQNTNLRALLQLYHSPATSTTTGTNKHTNNMVDMQGSTLALSLAMSIVLGFLSIDKCGITDDNCFITDDKKVASSVVLSVITGLASAAFVAEDRFKIKIGKLPEPRTLGLALTGAWTLGNGIITATNGAPQIASPMYLTLWTGTLSSAFYLRSVAYKDLSTYDMWLLGLAASGFVVGSSAIEQCLEDCGDNNLLALLFGGGTAVAGYFMRTLKEKPQPFVFAGLTALWLFGANVLIRDMVSISANIELSSSVSANRAFGTWGALIFSALLMGDK